MSADLFALFGDPSQTATPQQNQTRNQGPHGTAASNTKSTTPGPGTAGDPFSFLASNVSNPAAQVQSTQWPPFQESTAAQTSSSWFTSPVHDPQNIHGWAGFGNPGPSSGALGVYQSSTPPLQTTQEPADTEEDDDGWGDFEVAQSGPPPPPPAPVTTTNPPRARVMRASTIDMMTNKLVDLGLEATAPEPWQQRPSWEKDAKKLQPQKPARNPDPDVLFDADFEAANDANDDDDFGDFETGTPAAVEPQPAPPVISSATLDLLSLDPTPAPSRKQPPGLTLSNAALQTNPAAYPEAPKSPYGTFQDRKPEVVKQLQVKPPTVAKALKEVSEASPSPVTAWPAVEADGFGNKWEEFTDLPDTTKRTPKSKLNPAPTSTAAAATAPDWEWQDWGAAEDQPTQTTQTISTPQPPMASQEPPPGPPPTNIPPPAILLSLFPPLLDLASSTLLKPLLTLPPSSPAHQRVLASPQTHAFLRGYLSLATVAARLIAGRKHRWHRDRFLAQGMSISAAAAAGGGAQRGMKLASVDRSQAAHEDREAGEVVGVWKRQVGRLRTVVAGVNAAAAAQAGAAAAAAAGEQRALLRVPEVALEGVALRTAKGVPTAPRACVVCGLKRDERLAKVDGEVEDSFGEWWVEFWGHRECRNFWLGHEKELRQR